MAVSLVSYDSSDDDSDEESDSSNSDHIKETVAQKSPSYTRLKQENENLQISKSLYTEDRQTCQSHEKVEKQVDDFPPLPKPKFHDTDIDWNCLKILKDSQSGIIKISAPSLIEVEDKCTLEPKKKKLKPSEKRSGLFALLPSPKREDKLIPQVLSRKNNDNSHYKSVNSYKTVRNEETVCDVSDCVKNKESDCVKNKELNFLKDNDFFSLSSSENNSILIKKTPEDFPDNRMSEVLRSQYADKEINNVDTCNSLIMTESIQQEPLCINPVYEKESLYPVATASFTSVGSNIKLNDMALNQLCGTRDRHKLKAENLELIDISGDSIMPDSREWLTKQLTEESQYTSAHSHKKKDGPTSQQKRKHQITYLAFQAKEHELELKNQWASNRMSRKQTQAKYGF